MICTICESPVAHQEALSFYAKIENRIVATCSARHREQAERFPKHCSITPRTELIGIPVSILRGEQDQYMRPTG